MANLQEYSDRVLQIVFLFELNLVVRVTIINSRILISHIYIKTREVTILVMRYILL